MRVLEESDKERRKMMETKRYLSPKELCEKYDWIKMSGLRWIIRESDHGRNKFRNVFYRLERSVLIDEEAFLKCYDNYKEEK